MKTDTLSIIANQQKLGVVTCRGNRLAFSYNPAWQASPEAFPLSVSMPLAGNHYPHEVIDAYLWGLLPDNQSVLDQWGRQFHVSPRNVFRLLSHVGEDCPGAIQFIPEDKEDTWLNQSYEEQVEWLDETELAHLIRKVCENQGIQRTASDQGQFSLAGAQPKTALYQSPDTGAWGIPSGLTPTTHILKPALGVYDGIVENEHFCMQLSAALGISTAESTVIHTRDTPVIVVKRYDRFATDGQYYRIHQEDFCQARAVYPHLKYQSDGGPSVENIAQTLWDNSSNAYEDILTFADALIYNYLIAGTDAHAKNYSLLFAGGNRVQLAPLYDIASALPYPQIYNPHKVRLAMKIGSEYPFKKIELRHWQACGKQLRIGPDDLLERFQTLAGKIQQLAPVVADNLHTQGLTHPIIDDLAQLITQRATDTLRRYA
jgi:serine/threonine-protein kinase HipA